MRAGCSPRTEHAPSDDLRLAFEAISELEPDERSLFKHLIEPVLFKHEAERWAS